MAKCDCMCDCNAVNEELCNSAKKSIENIKDLNRVVDFYKTFADSTRIKIICALDSVKEMCVCDIAYALNMTKSAISHQLNYLKKNNMVKSRRDGKEVYYSLSDAHVKDIYEIGINHIEE